MFVTKSFEVIVRKRIPFLTTFLFYSSILSFLIFGSIFIYYLPSHRYQPILPHYIKNYLMYSFFGGIILYLLFVYLRQIKNAVLTFFEDKIEVQCKAFNISFPVDQIEKIQCIDARGPDGFPKGKVTFYFLTDPLTHLDKLVIIHSGREPLRNRFLLIWIRLKNYPDIDDFMEILTSYPSLDIQFSDMVYYSVFGGMYKVF